MIVITVAFVLSLHYGTADEAKTEIENLYEEYFNWKLKTWPEDISGSNLNKKNLRLNCFLVLSFFYNCKLLRKDQQ